MDRKLALIELEDMIVGIQKPHPLRVGIDGIDCAGKSTLADELDVLLRGKGHDTIRASIDGFHNPRAIRYHEGRSSPQGYFQDSFDLGAVLTCLLLPLGPGGSMNYQVAVYDFRSDRTMDTPVQTAKPASILLFDGIFLHRPELMQYFDITIFVETSYDTALKRAIKRDTALLGNEQAVVELYHQRYIPAQRLYLAQFNPLQKANIVFLNDNLNEPDIIISGDIPEDG